MKPHASVYFVGVLLTVFAMSLIFTSTTYAASLTSASVTLSNSRMSYKAGVAVGTSGSSLVTITGSGFPDNNTNHLFPGDVVCFTNAGQDGCIGSKTYTVGSIVDGTKFNLTTALTDNLDTSGYAVASQSGQWSVAFTTVAEVPVGGSILLTIPMADNANGNNGIPDSSSAIGTSGFDLRSLGTSDIAISGCTPANWGTPVITAGSGATDHTIAIPRATAACAASTAIVVTLGGVALPWIVNPAPITSGHVQGTADVYGVTVATRNGSNNTIDSSIPRAAPVEAVLISATVDETLSLVVAGLTGGAQSYCGAQTYTTTTATSVPWGSFAATDTFKYAAQSLTVSTNASAGYAVTIQENDQMGRSGNVCTGTSPSAGQYTFGAGTCIRDTVCSAATPCTETVMGDWPAAANYPGLGYSLATSAGTPATFFYNQGGRTFNTKQLADKGEGAETPQTIMSSSVPVSGDAIYVCYKISIQGTQPAGYYYNVAKYTATATF